MVAKAHPEIPKEDILFMVNATFDSVTQAIANGERVEIRGFGSFIPKHREARKARNPNTGEAINVDARTTVQYKASINILDKLNK